MAADREARRQSPAAVGQVAHLVDHAGVVGHRVGVGHGARPRCTRRSPPPGYPVSIGLLVLEARLAEVGVQVDETRAPATRPRAVDHLGAAGLDRPRRDHAVLDQDVGRTPSYPAAGSTTRPPRKDQRAHVTPPPSPDAAEHQVQQRHADRDAVRHLLLDHASCGRSATSESISTPRFIGPGCMIERSSREAWPTPVPVTPEQPRVLADAGEELAAAAAPAGPGARSRRPAWAGRGRSRSETCTPHAGASGGISVGVRPA